MKSFLKKKLLITGAAIFTVFSGYGTASEYTVCYGQESAISVIQEAEGQLVGPVKQMTRQRGKRLQPGDCIGVLAPASRNWGDADYSGAVQLLESYGYRVKFSPYCMGGCEHFSGTDEERAADINAFFQDDEVNAILCLKGGYGSARILDKLDYKAIAAHPKLFIGFSDITALHTVLGERCNMATVHGPMLVSFRTGGFANSYTEENFFQGLKSESPVGEIPMPVGKRLETVVPGRAEGVITGGNLAVLSSLAGTPYELRGDGALLFIEETGEDPYRVDRMLRQLWLNGLLSRVNGILIGEFRGGEDDLDSGDYTTKDVLNYYARLSGKPVIRGIPAGHGAYNMFLPFGVQAVMNAGTDGTASLQILDTPLR